MLVLICDGRAGKCGTLVDFPEGPELTDLIGKKWVLPQEAAPEPEPEPDPEPAKPKKKKKGK